jgi:hypothetical protein
MPTYEQNKASIYRYAERNPEKVKAQARKNSKAYYERNKENVRAAVRERYHRQKVVVVV